MSLLWSSARIRVHLAAGVLAACEVEGRGRRARVVRKQRFRFAPDALDEALDDLREWIADAGRRPPLEWVLGACEPRYLLLPWTPGLAEPGFGETLAAELFEQRFRQSPGSYAVRLATPVFGRAQLASFVPRELIAQIASHARESRCRLARIEPGVATVWRRFRPVLQAECGEVRLVDGERQLVVRHEHGRIVDVALRSLDEDVLAPWSGVQAARGPSMRVFSSLPHGALGIPHDAALVLAEGKGFKPAEDAAYAFALCGVF